MAAMKIPLLVSVLLFLTSTSGLNVIVLNGNIYELINLTLNETTKYLVIFQNNQSINPCKVNVWTPQNVSKKHPLFVEVEQERNVLSWTVPLSLQTSNNTIDQYHNTSRTLCNVRFNKSSDIHDFTVLLSTFSPSNIEVSLIVDIVDFYVYNNILYNISVSPSQPQYFFYNYTSNEYSTVLINVSSSDELCLTMSIQKIQCPVFDLDQAISSYGIHQTFNKNGAMRISKEEFPRGFFLVFVGKVDDYLCQTRVKPFGYTTRDSQIYFTITYGISDWYFAFPFWILLVLIIALILINCGIELFFFKMERREAVPDQDNPDQNVGGAESVDTDQDNLDNEMEEPLTIADLCRNLPTNHKQARNYLCHILIIVLFYTIPTFQLSLTYQKAVNKTGDTDTCYFNYQCANPAWIFSDVNHVYSNIGYIFMGIAFLVIIVTRRKYHIERKTGIPEGYSIYSAMGIALISEGVLSACYHICPNEQNFQFDTTFMYAMGILCIVKVYENRHFGKTPASNFLFLIFALIMIIAVFGIVRIGSSIALAVILFILYVILHLYISTRIYDNSNNRNKWITFWNGLRCNNDYQLLEDQIQTININDQPICEKLRKVKVWVILCANVANNILLIIVMCLFFIKDLEFGELLLFLLIGNGVVYTVSYIVMKYIGKEKLTYRAWFYLLMGALWGGLGIYFFQDYVILSSASSAESRNVNQGCVFLDFYDKHDLWHFFSAAALYYIFMFFLHLDDDVIHKDRKRIFIF